MCRSQPLCLLLLMLLPSSSLSATPPNVLLIMADDLGYADAGCYGGEIKTPNLDALADGGIRYAQFYSTGRCWPSRAALLTGYYAQQVRRDTFDDTTLGNRPDWAPLLPVLLHEAGYRNYHSGKWHLDGDPLKNGFDQSYSLHDQDRFFTPKKHFLDDVALPQPESDSGYYATTAIADHAVDTLKKHAADHPDDPFFHYLAFTAPHFPLHALQEDIDAYRTSYLEGWDVIRQRRWERQTAMGLIDCPLSPLDPDIKPPYNLSWKDLEDRIGPGEIGQAVPWGDLTETQRHFQATKMAIHAAMVNRVDQEIGRVLDQLRTMGAMENTVIIFVSDNGASAEQIIRADEHDKSAVPGSAASYLCLGPGFSSAANTPFRLHKSWTNEGGIASPLIVHWPAGIKARGEIRQQTGHFVDVVPTLLDLAGVNGTQVSNTGPTRPGRSLASSFTTDNSVDHDFLWWHHEGRSAIRVGDWKAVRREDEVRWALYDLATDRSEINNVGEKHPEILKGLQTCWEAEAVRFKAQGAQN